MNPFCVVCNNSVDKRSDCVLFSFPDKNIDPVQYHKYLVLCDINETDTTDETLYICSTHYTEADFVEGSPENGLLEDTLPSLHLERIEIETYVDEDFQILDEYAPLFNVKAGRASPDLDDQDDTLFETNSQSLETLLVPKLEPVEANFEETIITEVELKTEAPELDEEIPDPFDNVEPASSDRKYCILCGDDETKNPDCRLYIFPRKIPRVYRKWIIAACLDPDQYTNVDIYCCQRHFPENGFFADGKYIQSWATPKFNLPSRKSSPSKTYAASTKAENVLLNPSDDASYGENSGPQIIIRSNPENRKNAEALNIDPDSYAKTFARVVMKLVPKTLNYNGEERPVKGTIVFQSNLF